MNCLLALGKEYKISHIYREGNVVTDAISNEDFGVYDFTRWYYVPSNATSFNLKNLEGRQEYKFV